MRQEGLGIRAQRPVTRDEAEGSHTQLACTSLSTFLRTCIFAVIGQCGMSVRPGLGHAGIVQALLGSGLGHHSPTTTRISPSAGFLLLGLFYAVWPVPSTHEFKNRFAHVQSPHMRSTILVPFLLAFYFY